MSGSKLVVAYIVENDEDCLELSFESIKEVVDDIVIVDGNRGSDVVYSIPGNYIYSPYPHDDAGADGKQRNKYLNYLKEHHLGDWCLVLDADEVLEENPLKIKELIKSLDAGGFDCASPKMRHFINHLGQEDATQETHYVGRRLFKITKELFYPETEHNTLQGIKKECKTDNIVIWHLGYAREMFRIKKKTANHLKKSNIHSKAYLEDWSYAHLLGQYPVKPVPWEEIPSLITEHFGIIPDKLYFRDRRLEAKHFIDASHWKDHFKPSNVLEVGCGLGHRLYALQTHGVSVQGVELSEWAVNNSPYKISMINVDIKNYLAGEIFDLVVSYDVLEHVAYEDLEQVLLNIRNAGKAFLFSIPFLGDPNLDADPTHLIKESRAWWEEQLVKAGFVIKPTPSHFLFPNQLVVCE